MWQPGGGGECGALIRETDWASTPLGHIESWPTSLQALVHMMLMSRHPMFLWWGPELTQIYNDAYVPSFGVGKHPAAMGQPGADCWEEIWPIIGPQIDGVMTRGEATWHENARVPIFRNGRIEEVFWTYGYSPAYGDDGEIAGTLVVCTETTSGVLANRRLELVARATQRLGAATRAVGLLDEALSCFAELPEDVPFVGVYDVDGRPASPVFGLDASHGEVVASLAARCGTLASAGVEPLARGVDAGPWPEPVVEAFVVPLDGQVMVFGLSPRLSFDTPYRDFLLQLVDSWLTARDRVEAIERRVAAEREQRDLLIQAPVATALLRGPDLIFELANPRYVQMVGREVVGQAYLEAFPELEGSDAYRAVRQAYDAGIPFSTDEMCLPIDRDDRGEVQDVYFSFNLEPVRDGEGEVIGLMAIAVDVTESVLARRSQARAHTERLELISQLEAASRAKDEFLAILGHELRNPLSPIITALELMRRRDDARFAREHAIIERQARHLVRLVDDLLDVARITDGKIELRRERCELRDVVSRAIEMSSRAIERRRHHLSVTVPEPMTWWGDPVRLAQVLSNLLINAARYTDPGGHIGLDATAVDAGLEIRVSDTGQGLSPQMLDRIFELFVQGDRTVSGARGGLGLGLSLSRNLIELHGGRLSASSAGPGQGSTFLIELPVTAVAREAATVDVASAAGQRSHRILIVDDNIDAAETLGVLLEASGHVVAVRHDGPSALEIAEGFAPEIAILDIGLPVMDGYELAGHLARRGVRRLIAVTGYGQREDRERSRAVGFDVHLVKPVAIEQLEQAVAEVAAVPRCEPAR